MSLDDSHGSDLPRILCLHGGGTNARIFRSQCRVLSAHLKDKFRLVFAEAPLGCQAGPDVLSVYKEWGPFKSWVPSALGCAPMDSDTSICMFNNSLQHAMDLDDNNGATGPWVGLLGFSQGAKMCASLLLLQQLRHLHGVKADRIRDFRFGILLAGRAPLIALDPTLIGVDAPRQIVGPNDEEIYGNDWLPDIYRDAALHRLRIPTVHVHGLRDSGLSLHRRMLEDCCDTQATRLMEWEGSHRVPIKTKDVTALVQHIISIAEETGVRIDRL